MIPLLMLSTHSAYTVMGQNIAIALENKQVQPEAAMCLAATRANSSPAAPGSALLLGERRACPALLCSVQPLLLHWVQVWVPQDRYHCVIGHPKEGNKDGEGSEGNLCKER